MGVLRGLIRGMEGWAGRLDSVQGGGLGERGFEYWCGPRVEMRLLMIPVSLGNISAAEGLRPSCMA